MRVLLMGWAFVGLLVVAVTNSSCQNCPDGTNASGSLYCHSAQCAANENICAGACSNIMYDRDNCGTCGMVCGDGLACSQGVCVEACADPTQTRCNGVCLDLTTDQGNCGACAAPCTNGNTCGNSMCACSGVTCAGQCIDPTVNNLYCGATTDCTGTNSGQQCATNEACNNGVCRSGLIYRGSLPANNGLWNYAGQLGIAGASALCQSSFGNAANPADVVAICTYAQLQAASLRTPAETINAKAGVTPVTDWWIDDPNDLALTNNASRCADLAAHANLPWTYATAHLGNVGKYTTLTPGTGAISALVAGTPDRPGPVVGNVALCNVARFVPCCTQ